MIIAYNTPEGLALVRHLEDSGVSIEELAAMVVPEGTQYTLASDEDLPADNTYAEAWVLAGDPPQVTVDPTLAEAVDRRIALRELEEWFAAQTAAGFATAGGWKLGLQPSDVTLLTGNFVLSKEAAAMGGPIPPVIDTDGVPHPMADITELTAIMLGYGMHRATLSAEYAARKADIIGG